MKIETERLLLRPMEQKDFDALYAIFSDAETMRHYPHPFDEKKVHSWINWNIENERVFGFGLCAVVLKETGEVIGDCGCTMQMIHDTIKPEIGYHIRKDLWRKGFATEAARAVKDFLFENTTFNALYTYCKYTNVPSYSVAVKNGMKHIEDYPEEKNEVTSVYAITREEWKARANG